MASPDSSDGGNALDVFAGWLSRRGNGEQVEFEELLRGHPDLAAELVKLEATWRGLSEANDPSRSASSLREEIKSRFGKESVPDVALRAQEKEGAREDFTVELIAQLSAHSKGFGRYRIRGEVARGGMGAILKIWDEDLRRHLAMKVILGQADASVSGETPPVKASHVARFLEEAQVTGQLDHPGVVPVHELGLDPEGRLYFTMKLVKGRSLKEIFDLVADGKEGWTQTKALGVMLKICEAMAYTHDKGVIHRDLKPANVMVGKFGEVHVMDWGLARILDRPDRKDIRIREEDPPSTELRSEREEHRGATPDSPLFTMDGDVVGTPAYMPPEQAAGRMNEVGPHSDVYALGAMLYHLLAGHPPYVPRGAKLNNYAVWGLVQQSAPTPILHLAPGTPAELVAICEKAMKRDWAKRYRDMSEMAEDLSAYLEHRVVSAYETGAWAETKKWVERNKAFAAAVATGMLALAGSSIVSFSLKRQADASAADANHQKSIAIANAKLAEERRVKAEANEQLAKEQEALAKNQTANVLRLSAFQTLDDLTKEADELWPAEPKLVDRLEAWLDRAKELVARIPEFRASLEELEKRAPPQTDEEREAEQRSHPQYATLGYMKLAVRLYALRLGELNLPSEASVETELDSESLPKDVEDVRKLAWSYLHDTAAQKYGSEVKALLIARRAVSLATEPKQRAECRYAVANALVFLGRLEDAAKELRIAMTEADEVRRTEFELEARQYEHDTEFVGRLDHAAVLSARDFMVKQVEALEREVSKRRNWGFTREDDRWWHAQMDKLVAALSEFADEKSGLVYGTSPSHGWGIAKRLAYAESIEERSMTGTEASRRWSEAIDAIEKSEKYINSGMLRTVDDQGQPQHLKPQLGLLPIGVDPESGLWEFSHLATAEGFEPAVRGANGKLLLNEGTGLVLVLIPGGTFWMGAQNLDPNGHNYDPQAKEEESPVNEETLAPYFLSKYEMTQGQWVRLTGKNPSRWTQSDYNITWNREHKPWNLLHPVTSVSWFDCDAQLKRLELEFPTEAEWERACRGGTSSAWSSGDDAETLSKFGNVADAYAKAHGADTDWAASCESWDDGNTCTAEVGSYRANPFGLHDMHGNVCEWCRESTYHNSYTIPTHGIDASREIAGVKFEACETRGGGYGDPASFARSAARITRIAAVGTAGVGLRPAKSIVQ